MPQATVSDPRGLKRICMSCSTRFYDLNKRPVICPNCDTEFTGEVKIKARRGRLAANDVADDTEVEDAVETAEVEEEEAEEEEAETVSLEEVEVDADEDEDLDIDEDDLDADLDDDLDDDDDLDVELDEDDK
ncbi:MAG: TIGR02300 family protein [Micavibrio aeruginosavorus]|uniref:TIGR02300 family protein n=1 Tax=Micavibrio aeruginosavorus TaxID=349221 RepID=A0A2W5HLU7_9BACT|nr:MAG: TIGR02300 family protein [Micavibrio aeruginosavorus]